MNVHEQPQLVLYLTPNAIREAFDGWGDEREQWINSATDEQLNDIGEVVLEGLYERYRDLLEEQVDLYINQD